MGRETQTKLIASTVRFTVVIGAMFIFLHLNATNFDSTELKSIFGVALFAAAGEGLTEVFKK